MANVTLLPRTTAIGYYHQNFLGLCQRLTDHLAEPPATAPRERMWRVRAEQVVLAQGAIEKPLVFDGHDRPGVLLAGGNGRESGRERVGPSEGISGVAGSYKKKAQKEID